MADINPSRLYEDTNCYHTRPLRQLPSIRILLGPASNSFPAGVVVVSKPSLFALPLYDAVPPVWC